MLDTRYGFISAFLKGAEAKVITHDHINRVARATSFEDVLTGIIDTGVGQYLEEIPVNTFDDVDRHLWGYLAKCVAQIESCHFLPGDVVKVLKTYTLKYDVRNLKAALWQILTGKKVRMLPLGVIHNHGWLDELSAAEDSASVIDILTGCNLGDYVSVLKGSKIEEGAKPSLITEAELDSVYYRNFLDTARRVKDGFVLSQALGILIDLTNLQIVCRAIVEGISLRAAPSLLAGGYLIPAKEMAELLSLKLADVPARLGNAIYRQVLEEMLSTYNKSQRITAIEETLDKHKFRMLKEVLSPRVLSPLVVVWYLMLKEIELRDLRLILKAVFDNISPEEIKPYLIAVAS